MSLPRRIPAAADQATDLRIDVATRRKVPIGVFALVAAATLWFRPGLVVVFCGLAALRWARLALRRRAMARTEREALVRQLPSVLTLLRLAAASGQGPRDAIRIAGSAPDGAATDFFAAAADRLRAGADLHTALWFDTQQVDAGLSRLLNVLERADRDGVALAPHLEQLGDDLQRSRLVALEQASQRAAVAILFPLVLCILPAFLFLSLLPLLFSVVTDLSS